MHRNFNLLVMAQGRKTGGRQKGTPNKPNPLKEHLRTHSEAYFKPTIKVEDEETANILKVEVGTLVSRFDIDSALMEPKERAAAQIQLLPYHTAKMQSVSAEVSLSGDVTTTIEERLADLAKQNDM